MPDFGSGFGGGFAQGFGRTSEVFQGQQQMQLQIEMARRRMDAAQMEQLAKAGDEALKIISKTIEGVNASGNAQKAATVYPLLKQYVQGNASLFSMNRQMDTANMLVQSGEASFVPLEEQEKLKGKAAGVGKAAERGVPGSQAPEDLITLGRDDKVFSFRKGDPNVDKLIGLGFTEVKTPVAQVNIVNESALQKNLGDEVGKLISGVIQRGSASAASEPTLMQMADLLGGGVQTGAIQPALTRLQAIAQDLGVDLTQVGKRFGMNLGQVTTKEQFDRLATEVIIGGFEKFKGNLNAQEVAMSQAAFANLGRSEETNVDAVATGLAGIQIAKERAQRAVAAAVTGSKEEARKVLTEQVSGESTVRFRELQGRYRTDIQDRMRQSRELSQQAPKITSIEEVQKSTKEQLKLFVKQLTPEQHKMLPEDVRAELLRRLKE